MSAQKDLVLTAQLVHLMFEFAVAFLHAIEQSVRDAALHTVELVLVRGVGQIHVAVRLPQQLFLVKFLYVRPFLFHLFTFWRWVSSEVTRTGMMRFTLDFGSLKRTRKPDLKPAHFQYISAPEYLLWRK